MACNSVSPAALVCFELMVYTDLQIYGSTSWSTSCHVMVCNSARDPSRPVAACATRTRTFIAGEVSAKVFFRRDSAAEEYM